MRRFNSLAAPEQRTATADEAATLSATPTSHPGLAQGILTLQAMAGNAAVSAALNAEAADSSGEVPTAQRNAEPSDDVPAVQRKIGSEFETYAETCAQTLSGKQFPLTKYTRLAPETDEFHITADAPRSGQKLSDLEIYIPPVDERVPANREVMAARLAAAREFLRDLDRRAASQNTTQVDIPATDFGGYASMYVRIKKPDVSPMRGRLQATSGLSARSLGLLSSGAGLGRYLEQQEVPATPTARGILKRIGFTNYPAVRDEARHAASTLQKQRGLDQDFIDELTPIIELLIEVPVEYAIKTPKYLKNAMFHLHRTDLANILNQLDPSGLETLRQDSDLWMDTLIRAANEAAIKMYPESGPTSLLWTKSKQYTRGSSVAGRSSITMGNWYYRLLKEGVDLMSAPRSEAGLGAWVDKFDEPWSDEQPDGMSAPLAKRRPIYELRDIGYDVISANDLVENALAVYDFLVYLNKIGYQDKLESARRARQALLNIRETQTGPLLTVPPGFLLPIRRYGVNYPTFNTAVFIKKYMSEATKPGFTNPMTPFCAASQYVEPSVWYDRSYMPEPAYLYSGHEQDFEYFLDEPELPELTKLEFDPETVDIERGIAQIIVDGKKGWVTLANLKNIAPNLAYFQPVPQIVDITENTEGRSALFTRRNLMLAFGGAAALAGLYFGGPLALLGLV